MLIIPPNQIVKILKPPFNFIILHKILKNMRIRLSSFNFCLSISKPNPQHRVIHTPSSPKSLLQLFHRMRHNKNPIKFNSRLINLQNTLNINIQYTNFPSRRNFINSFQTSPIIIRMHFSPFNKLISFNFCFEFFFLYKIIMLSMNFSLTRLSSCS